MRRLLTPGNATFVSREALATEAEPRPISVRLAKRLAEAAAGLVPTGCRYIVASYAPIEEAHRYFVHGCTTHDEAETFVNDHTELDLGIFGPYEYGAMSKGTPRPATAKSPPSKLITEVSLKLKGGEIVDPISGADFDAIFWGYPAIEKFVLPYYAGAEGLDVANYIDTEYQDPDTYLLAHSNDTEYHIYKLVKKLVEGGGTTYHFMPVK